MTDERAKQLKAQIKTVRNLANSPETRELCTILISVMNELPKSDKLQQCGFGPKTGAGDVS